jgi:tartrate-resistant acid phosphatase type 5
MIARTRMLLTALALCWVVVLPAPAHARQPDTMSLVVPKDALNFLAFGDWGRNGEYHQRDVAEQMAIAAKALDAEFVLALGDNFYPSGVQSTADPQWRASFEDIYTAHALQVDWYVVLGNHDYRGNPRAQVEYSAISRRWRLPAPYYSVKKEVGDGVYAEFIVIDTSPFIKDYRTDLEKYHVAGTDTTAQRVWLDSTLVASTAQWKFIVGHHNVYSGGKRPVMEDMAELIAPRLERHGVTAYIAGHEHHLEHIVPEGSNVHYFISGAGSETRDATGMAGTRFVAPTSGFFAMSLMPDTLLVQAIDYTGRVLYRAAIPRAASARTSAAGG